MRPIDGFHPDPGDGNRADNRKNEGFLAWHIALGDGLPTYDYQI